MAERNEYRKDGLQPTHQPNQKIFVLPFLCVHLMFACLYQTRVQVNMVLKLALVLATAMSLCSAGGEGGVGGGEEDKEMVAMVCGVCLCALEWSSCVCKDHDLFYEQTEKKWNKHPLPLLEKQTTSIVTSKQTNKKPNRKGGKKQTNKSLSKMWTPWKQTT